MAAARSCDLILLIMDATKPVTHKIIIEKELHGFGIRLNQVQSHSEEYLVE